MLREDHKQILKQLCELDDRYSPKDIYFNTAKYVITTRDGKTIDVTPIVKTSVMDLEILRDEGWIIYHFDTINGSRIGVRPDAHTLVDNSFKEPGTLAMGQIVSQLSKAQKDFLSSVHCYLIFKHAKSVTFNATHGALLANINGDFEESQLHVSSLPDDTEMHLLEKYGYILRLEPEDGICSANPSFTKSNSRAIKLLPKALRTVDSKFITTVTTKDPMEVQLEIPVEITESFAKFKEIHSDRPVCFIMMKFEDTPEQLRMLMAIKQTLLSYGITGVRADDRKMHKDLLTNIKTYMHGCKYGLTIFDRVRRDDFNPNVSFELGYMYALKKEVCLLEPVQ